MDVLVPPGSLVLMVGVSGSGKSTLAASAFAPSQVVSSDALRGMVADDPADQSATRDAFDLLDHLVRLRLARRLTTVVDATSVKPDDRKGLLRLAADAGAPTRALVVDVPLEVALARNAARTRVVPEKAIRRQEAALRAGLDSLREEVDAVFVLGEDDTLTVRTAEPGLDLSRWAGGFDLDTPAGPVSVPAGGVAAALEVLDRFGAPRLALSYLPPTMSPVETSRLPGTLEHPAEAFVLYRREGVGQVVCEEKHMGSRATFLLCRTPQVAARFGVPGTGTAWTRRGRPFFAPADAESVLAPLRAALVAAGVDEDWVLLDAEVLPWNFRPGLVSEFAAVSASGLASLPAELGVLSRAAARGLDVASLVPPREAAAEGLSRFEGAYREFCWPVTGTSGVAVAPFHLLATSGGVVDLAERDHAWHMGLAGRMAAAAPDLVRPTAWHLVDVDDEDQVASATAWWEELTAGGGEGMVVKPLTGPVRPDGTLVQPGVKVRGREYLRLIYGPDYLEPERLSRLKKRSVKAKRSLALREWGLGHLGLERLCAGTGPEGFFPAVLGVLALDSERVDPRL